jgi:hypothetical protein
MVAICASPVPFSSLIEPMLAPLLSLTASPTLNDGGVVLALAPALALVFEPEPDAEGAASLGAVDGGAVDGVVEGVVDGDCVGGLALVEGGGAEVGALGGSLAGAAEEPPAWASAWPATARARPAAMRGKAERIRVSLGVFPQVFETARCQDRSKHFKRGGGRAASADHLPR